MGTREIGVLDHRKQLFEGAEGSKAGMMTKEVVKEREKWLEHMERSSPGGEHKFVAGKQGSSQAGPVT